MVYQLFWLFDKENDWKIWCWNYCNVNSSRNSSNRPLLICCHTRTGQRLACWSYFMIHTTKSTQLDPIWKIHMEDHDTQISGLIPTRPLPYGWAWGTTTEGTVYCCNLSEQVIKWNDPPIYQYQQPKIPQFVQNQGQWELTWENLTGNHYQKLLQFQRQKWNLAITENFPKCNAGLLLSLFSIELPQEEENTILDSNTALTWCLGVPGVSKQVNTNLLWYHSHKPDLLYKWPLLQLCYRP